MIDVCICSQTNKDTNYEVGKSDLRCTEGVEVSFTDLKVCKRSLRGFSWDFLILKIRYEGIKVYDVAMCIVLRLWCCSQRSYSGNDVMRFVRAWRLHVTRVSRSVYGMKNVGEAISNICMNILDWCLHIYWWVGA